MKATGKVWVFFDSQKQKETKPMSLVQAQMALLQYKTSDIAKTFIWTPGWDNWIPLKDFLKSDQTYFVLGQPPKPQSKQMPTFPASPARTPRKPDESSPEEKNFTKIELGAEPLHKKVEYGYWHNDFTGDQLDLEKISTAAPFDQEEVTQTKSTDDRRRAQRHSFKIEILLMHKKGSFRTFSKNISLTGTLIENKIPQEFLSVPFDLIIINRFEKDARKGRLLFKGRVVGDLANPKRLMFVDPTPEMTQRLEQLLKDYIQYQQSLRKSG